MIARAHYEIQTGVVEEEEEAASHWGATSERRRKGRERVIQLLGKGGGFLETEHFLLRH